MDRLFPQSPFVPWEMSDWLVHRQEMVQAQGRQLQRALERKETQKKLEKSGLNPLMKPFQGHEFKGNYSAVLCQQTIFCPNWHLKKERAPWPSIQELKWEGDDRASTKVGRFLPLPRQPDNPTVAWHHLRVLKQFYFDQVRLVPTMEDIFLPVDEIDEDVVPDLLIKELADALDPQDIL